MGINNPDSATVDLMIEQGNRLKKARKSAGINQSELAQNTDTQQSHVSAMESGTKKIQTGILEYLSRRYSVSADWILTGKGEIFSAQTSPQVIADPSMDDVDRLRKEVLDKYQPTPPLTVKQDLSLRQACYKTMVDNPGQPWPALVIGAGVYLRFIEAYPNLQIPEAAAGG